MYLVSISTVDLSDLAKFEVLLGWNNSRIPTGTYYSQNYSRIFGTGLEGCLRVTAFRRIAGLCIELETAAERNTVLMEEVSERVRVERGNNQECVRELERLFPHVSITKGPFSYNTMNKRVPLVSMVSVVSMVSLVSVMSKCLWCLWCLWCL